MPKDDEGDGGKRFRHRALHLQERIRRHESICKMQTLLWALPRRIKVQLQKQRLRCVQRLYEEETVPYLLFLFSLFIPTNQGRRSKAKMRSLQRVGLWPLSAELGDHQEPRPLHAQAWLLTPKKTSKDAGRQVQGQLHKVQASLSSRRRKVVRQRDGERFHSLI